MTMTRSELLLSLTESGRVFAEYFCGIAFFAVIPLSLLVYLVSLVVKDEPLVGLFLWFSGVIFCTWLTMYMVDQFLLVDLRRKQGAASQHQRGSEDTQRKDGALPSVSLFVEKVSNLVSGHYKALTAAVGSAFGANRGTTPSLTSTTSSASASTPPSIIASSSSKDLPKNMTSTAMDAPHGRLEGYPVGTKLRMGFRRWEYEWTEKHLPGSVLRRWEFLCDEEGDALFRRYGSSLTSAHFIDAIFELEKMKHVLRSKSTTPASLAAGSPLLDQQDRQGQLQSSSSPGKTPSSTPMSNEVPELLKPAPWVDMELLEQGCRFYRALWPLISYQFSWAVVGGFGAEAAAAVLLKTRYWADQGPTGKIDTWNRLRETLCFLYDICCHGAEGFRPGSGPAWRSCLLVRFLHARTREGVWRKYGSSKKTAAARSEYMQALERTAASCLLEDDEQWNYILEQQELRHRPSSLRLSGASAGAKDGASPSPQSGKKGNFRASDNPPVSPSSWVPSFFRSGSPTSAKSNSPSNAESPEQKKFGSDGKNEHGHERTKDKGEQRVGGDAEEQLGSSSSTESEHPDGEHNVDGRTATGGVHVVQQEDSFDFEKYGEPINQAELIGTLLGSSVLLLHGLEEMSFGAKIPQKQKEGFVHLWRVVGYLFGIRDELNPNLNFAHGTTVMQSLYTFGIPAEPDPDLSSVLAVHICDSVAEGFATDLMGRGGSGSASTGASTPDVARKSASRVSTPSSSNLEQQPPAAVVSHAGSSGKTSDGTKSSAVEKVEGKQEISSTPDAQMPTVEPDSPSLTAKPRSTFLISPSMVAVPAWLFLGDEYAKALKLPPITSIQRFLGRLRMWSMGLFCFFYFRFFSLWEFCGVAYLIEAVMRSFFVAAVRQIWTRQPKCRFAKDQCPYTEKRRSSRLGVRSTSTAGASASSEGKNMVCPAKQLKVD
ncbi:unnamed protein product [Amoebophrya sp. A25]|nr:unnamed protein product [Amoebophrya sp. A25]|eukprot:GSA25T00026578001.1